MPLTGLRVLDLSRVLSRPYCTMLLADMGAEVIKVEVPGEGDLTRGIGDPESEAGGGPPVFFDLNPNKKSLTLNLKAMVLEHHHPTGRHRRWLGFPLRLTETPVDIHLPAPALGEHTEALHTGLGYSPERIETLRRDQVL
jgi:crotonobetainyl-CoA:carnitine CoA-transferase CaiB-like acyl-CoA transferase